MDSLDTVVHPQAWAAVLASVDLSIAWMIAGAAVIGLLRERNRPGEDTPSPSIGRRQRFA
jgi:hypothetical protein